MTPSFAISIPDRQRQTVLSVYVNRSLGIKDAVVTDTRQSPPVIISSSDCDIVSLEVYRGRQQIYQISDSGFSIARNSSIVVGVHVLVIHQFM